jgi:hypothetical protein
MIPDPDTAASEPRMHHPRPNSNHLTATELPIISDVNGRNTSADTGRLAQR